MMFGECGTGRNKVVHHYYKCATAKRFKTCKKKTVRKEWLEDLVVAETMKLIQDDAVIDAIVAEMCIRDRLYRYGFTDGEEHPLIGTAIYFHLTKGRAKKTEEQAMDNLWLELPWWFV